MRHDARNLQLKRRLAERGVDWRECFQTTCRFLAPNPRQASLLKQALYKGGFTAVEEACVPGKKVFWRVEAQARQSIDRSASHEFTEQMVRTAVSLSCIYDGWQVSLAGGQ